ncbi:peptidase S8 and S53 subtilisin kexin sedolisin [Eubacterium sp. CAG:603]|nr:peptidase S8 and S53 subtilisin kexin sedolisin [Eubacterium sp. CAG:603]
MDRIRKHFNIDYIHNMGITGKNIGIAVLDTGISNHIDLNDNLVCFKDYINIRKTAYDDNGHGSHVSGIIAGNGYKSKGRFKGIAPDSKIIMLKCLDKNGNGKIDNAEKGLNFIIDNRDRFNIRIVNISVGSIKKTDDNESERLVSAVEELWKLGFVVIVAAGNNGPDKGSVTAPGNAKSVITVGASDDNMVSGNDRRKNYSGRGPTKICVVKPEIVCPGTGIISCNNKNGYSTKSGTSMAVPIVSGIVALMLESKPDLTNKEIKKKMYETAIDVGLPKNHQGWGEINARRLIL